jgi:hypothetical protein
MFERFTREGRRVVIQAEREAWRAGAQAVGPEHLLIAAVEALGPWLFVEPGPQVHFEDAQPAVTPQRLRDLVAPGTDAEALAAIGISLAEVQRRIERDFGPEAWEGDRPTAALRFTAQAKRALEGALRETLELRGKEIRPQHVLLGVLRDENAAHDALRALGTDPAVLYVRVRRFLGAGVVTR